MYLRSGRSIVTFQGTIALFEISTTEGWISSDLQQSSDGSPAIDFAGWVDVMLAAVDSRGPYLQPKLEPEPPEPTG